MTKHYYRTIKFYNGTSTEDIWHCPHSTILTVNADVIIPLSRKPKAGTFDIIREG